MLIKRSVKRESLTQQIQSILIDRIVEGTLLPGARFKELQIADEFGTSQAPAREAIPTLQVMGYVEHKPHVGVIVKTYTSQEIKEVYQIREALEGHCLILAEIAIQVLVEKLDEQLGKMNKAMRKEDVSSFTKADNAFHRVIIESSGNKQMLAFWDSFKMQQQVIATHVEASMPLAELYALHPPIVALFRKKYRTGATRHLAMHYREIGKYWQKCN